MLDIGASLTRIEAKLDDMREHVHEIALEVSRTTVTQAQQDRDLTAMKAELTALKTAHDRAVGAVKLILLPGVLAALAAGYKILYLAG